jgi:hypothetical protein
MVKSVSFRLLGVSSRVTPIGSPKHAADLVARIGAHLLVAIELSLFADVPLVHVQPPASLRRRAVPQATGSTAGVLRVGMRRWHQRQVTGVARAPVRWAAAVMSSC